MKMVKTNNVYFIIEIVTSNGAQTLQIGAQTIDIYKKSTIPEKQWWDCVSFYEN